MFRTDFKPSTVRVGITHSDTMSKVSGFSILLGNKSNIGEIKYLPPYSVNNACKPLFYFGSLFGFKFVRYSENALREVRAFDKIHSISLIFMILALLYFVRPQSWLQTVTDLPLNILIKTFSLLNLTEVLYSIFITSLGNNGLYVKLLNTLHDIDRHFGTSRVSYVKTLGLVAILTLCPIYDFMATLWLRKFSIVNIISHLTFFLTILQGSTIAFFVVQIFTRLIVLNDLIVKKMMLLLPEHKVLIYKNSSTGACHKKLVMDRRLLANKLEENCCWFELIHLYDKVSDSIHLFNSIYAGQCFIMRLSWLVCTLVAICRSLSPSVKYSEVVLNDLFMYASFNARPIYLATMCQLLINERKKTLSILLHGLVHGNSTTYTDQIEIFLELVTTRKLEFTDNVITLSVSSILEFAGQLISFSVLMIQYFYMHVFSNYNQ